MIEAVPAQLLCLFPSWLASSVSTESRIFHSAPVTLAHMMHNAFSAYKQKKGMKNNRKVITKREAIFFSISPMLPKQEALSPAEFLVPATEPLQRYRPNVLPPSIISLIIQVSIVNFAFVLKKNFMSLEKQKKEHIIWHPNK